jgi:hypothetical protein
MRAERHVGMDRPGNLEGARELVGNPRYIGVVHQLESRVGAEAADNHHVVVFARFPRLQGPGGTAAAVARCQPGDEGRISQRHRFAVVQHPVDRVRLAPRRHCLQRRDILGHRHHLCAGQLLHRRVTFLMVAVGVAAEHDLDVAELEAQLFDRLLDERHIALERAVDQDVPLRRGDQEHGKAPRADVVDIPDHLVRREGRVHVVRAADVPLKQRELGEGLAPDRDGRPGLASGLGPAGRSLPRGNGWSRHRGNNYGQGQGQRRSECTHGAVRYSRARGRSNFLRAGWVDREGRKAATTGAMASRSRIRLPGAPPTLLYSAHPARPWCGAWSRNRARS